MNKAPAAVAIAAGSNVGDRAAHLAFAVSALSDLLQSIRVSASYETVPIGVPGAQPLFLNAAIVGLTRLTPRELLARLLAIERQRGRERPYVNAPRTLDLDLILAGDEIVDSLDLTVPHQRFRERRFVLEPLAEIAPEMRDPVTGLTVIELLRRLPPE